MSEKKEGHNRPAILTENEREGLAGEKSYSYQHWVRNLLRKRTETLPELLQNDINYIQETDPELYEEIREDHAALTRLNPG